VDVQPEPHEEVVMKKCAVGGMILVLVTLGWGTMSVGEQTPTPHRELRIVDTDPLNWAWITWNVFEHLVELDKDGNLVPRLATAWRWLDDRTLELTLRQGVTFHNGEVFDADIVKLNWDEYPRLEQPHRPGPYWNFTPGSRLEILDPYTIPHGSLIFRAVWENQRKAACKCALGSPAGSECALALWRVG
jgi:peptide/nickel transport system substrate-binding protein